MVEQRSTLVTVEPGGDTQPAPPQAENLRGEVCTVCFNKRDEAQKAGLELCNSKDGKWLVIAGIEPGTLCAIFSELKPGAKLLDIHANGYTTRQPSLEAAVRLISTAVGEVSITFMPLVDRYGFIISTEHFLANPVTRDMLKYENSQLRKWKRRVASPQAWQDYAARKTEKLRQRIRTGVPDAVRGFVWKLIAAARAPEGFRREGLYASLILKEEGRPAYQQIDKDVPRTMTEHIYFRGNADAGAIPAGQAALTRLLRAYAAFDPQISYVQGMSSYAAVLLLYMTEEDAFWTFATLMQHCGLSGCFAEGFPLLQSCYDTWMLLLKKHLPKLHGHILRQLLSFLAIEPSEYAEMVANGEPSRQLVPGVYTTYWFQTMLVGGDSPAPSAVAPRLMDSILLDGNLTVIFQAALGMLHIHRKELLHATESDLAEKLKQLPQRMGDIEQVMTRAYEFPVKPKHLLGARERA